MSDEVVHEVRGLTALDWAVSVVIDLDVDVASLKLELLVTVRLRLRHGDSDSEESEKYGGDLHGVETLLYS